MLSFERDLAFVCFFASARGEVSMNMKRFVHGDDDFLPHCCIVVMILTRDVTSVVVHVAR